MTDRYTKVLLTIITLCLIWLGVKDTPLEPVVSAQNHAWDALFQEWDDTALALGLSNPNLALPQLVGYAYVCYSRMYQGTGYASHGDYGALTVNLRSAPNCEGATIGTGRIFSEGATHSSSQSNYLYSEAGVMSEYENAARAAASGHRVSYYRCSNVKTTCLRALTFREGPAV